MQGPVSLGATVTEEIKDAKAPEPKKDGESKKVEARLAVIGDSDFVTNSLLGVQGNRDLFLNTLNWLSQQENLISDPAERSRRSADHAHRRPAAVGEVPCAADPAGGDFRRRHLQLDAEARMRSFRSIAVLGVLLAGLVAYLYFVDSKKPVDQAEEKAKVFAGLEADKIEEVKIDTVAGDTTVVHRRLPTAGSSSARPRRAPTIRSSHRSRATSHRSRSSGSSTRRRRISATTASRSRSSR